MSMELSPHGREQESSSEAIAAFEGIALFGNVMVRKNRRDCDDGIRAFLTDNSPFFNTLDGCVRG